MTANPSVSVVICAYTLDRWQDLREAVDSARAQEPPIAEIIVVIDHNPELEVRARAAFPDATVVSNTQKRGLSSARNSGIGVARGDFIAFLDDDAIADKSWIANLLGEEIDDSVSGMVPMIQPLWVGQRPAWFPDEFLWVFGCSYVGLPNQAQEVRNVLGGACCIRRDLFACVGGFNHRLGRTESKLPMGCEETEFCIRARQHLGNVKFLFQPASVTYHKVPASRVTWRYFTLRCYAEGLSKAYLAQIVGSKHGLSTERRYVLHTLTSGVMRGFRDLILRRDMAGPARAAAILWGVSTAAAGYALGRLDSQYQEVRQRMRAEKTLQVE